jgi:hypothetical protein
LAVAANQEANRFVAEERRCFEQHLETLFDAEVTGVNGEKILGRKSVALPKFVANGSRLVVR